MKRISRVGLILAFLIFASAGATFGGPIAPSGLTATSISNSQINLTWIDNSTDELAFYIYRSVDNITYLQLGNVGANTTSYSDTGLTASKTYYYEVQSFNLNGSSSFSNTASAVTGVVTATPPAAPSNLTAAASGNQINLSWTDNSGTESGFKISRSTDNVTFTQITTTGVNVTSFANTGLATSTTYYYRVWAYNAAGNSTVSNTAHATTGTSSSATVFYVSTTGSDVAAGTAANPWRTLRHALTFLQPGNQLYIRGGTYLERLNNITIHQGTASSPIHVNAYPGERPVLQGLLWLQRPSYWTISGLNVTWDSATGSSTEHMVKMINGVGWSYVNSEFWGARSYAALLVTGSVTGEPANWSVTNNCFHDTYTSNGTNQDHLLYVNTGLGAGAGLLDRNIVYNAANGAGIKLGGPDSSSGTVNVVVKRNTIYNTIKGVLVSWMSHDNQIYRNLLVKTSSNSGCINGFELTGQRNTAHDNAGYSAPQMILNDSGYLPVQDQGGEVLPVNPLFNSISPFAFHPQNTAAQNYGAYSP